jgi:hypothetical protein
MVSEVELTEKEIGLIDKLGGMVELSEERFFVITDKKKVKVEDIFDALIELRKPDVTAIEVETRAGVVITVDKDLSHSFRNDLVGVTTVPKEEPKLYKLIIYKGEYGPVEERNVGSLKDLDLNEFGRYYVTRVLKAFDEPFTLDEIKEIAEGADEIERGVWVKTEYGDDLKREPLKDLEKDFYTGHILYIHKSATTVVADKESIAIGPLKSHP